MKMNLHDDKESYLASKSEAGIGVTQKSSWENYPSSYLLWTTFIIRMVV